MGQTIYGTQVLGAVLDSQLKHFRGFVTLQRRPSLATDFTNIKTIKNTIDCHPVS